MHTIGLRLFTALVALSALSPPTRAAPGVILVADDGIRVEQAWSRASPGAATTGAAYISVTGGAQPDQITGVSTKVAASASIHTTTEDNGIMKMRAVPGVPVAPGQTVTFKPGGLHIMLEGLTHPLIAGQTFPMTVNFAHTAPVTVDVQVRPLGRDAPAGGHEHMHMQ